MYKKSQHCLELAFAYQSLPHPQKHNLLLMKNFIFQNKKIQPEKFFSLEAKKNYTKNQNSFGILERFPTTLRRDFSNFLFIFFESHENLRIL